MAKKKRVTGRRSHTKQRRPSKQQEAELKKQIKSEQARAEEIKEYEQYVQTDDYMKEIAEDKLNLVDPNEIVFKPIK